MDLKKIINKITMAGDGNVRVAGDNRDASFKIEIKVGGIWSPVISGLNKTMAEDIVAKASNRTILG